MGRRPTIDRDHVLDIAENIVSEHGAAALTIEAVAKAADISKGGVQSCFGTKEAMISAMLERWMLEYEKDCAALLQDKSKHAEARILAHIELSLGTSTASSERSAALVAALLHRPDHLEHVRNWYSERFAGLFEADDKGRLLRVAMLATEGAVLLRYFGLASLSESEWSVLHDDIVKLIAPPALI